MAQQNGEDATTAGLAEPQQEAAAGGEAAASTPAAELHADGGPVTSIPVAAAQPASGDTAAAQAADGIAKLYLGADGAVKLRIDVVLDAAGTAAPTSI